MSSDIAKKAVWGCVVSVLGIALGVVTAPLGMPMMATFLFKTKPDLSCLLGILTCGDMPAGWSDWMSKAVAAEGGPAELALWCLLALAVIAVVALHKWLNEPKRTVEQGILGDARLVTSPAAVRRRNDFWNGKDEPERAGLVFGSSKRGYVFDSSIPHWAIVGKTGVCKTMLMVLQTLHLCMARGWNLIVTGKDELLELTGAKAVDLGYNRVIFDLKGYPGASVFSPLDLIVEYADEGNVAEAQRTARQTAADLIPLGGEGNAYFPKAARSALTACLLIVAMAKIPRGQKNMASVCRLVNLGTTGTGKDPSSPLKDYIRSGEVGPDHPAYAPAAEFLSDGGLTVAGKNVLSTLKEALTIFNDAGIQRITAASDVSIRGIIREKTVVYMHLLEEGDPYLVLMTVFLNQYWRVAQQEAANNGGRLPRETAIIGDEWGNLPAVAAMPEIVTLGRSYRLHAWCFTQDLKQWSKYSRPGDQNAGRDKILGSMGGKVALSLVLPEDCQYFTRLAGKRTVRTQNTGTSKQGYGVGATSGSSEGYTERADDLIHEWEWQNRAPIRDGVIAVKGAENSKPGREGVFQVPVIYASQTPAGSFFGLGDEDECDAKRIAFRNSLVADTAARRLDSLPQVWAPDFAAFASEETRSEQVADDEWSAWDGM